MTTASITEMIDVARKYVKADHPASVMVSSAQLCLNDAVELANRGQEAVYYAKERVLASLRYTVGIYHPDYQRVLDTDPIL